MPVEVQAPTKGKAPGAMTPWARGRERRERRRLTEPGGLGATTALAQPGRLRRLTGRKSAFMRATTARRRGRCSRSPSRASSRPAGPSAQGHSVAMSRAPRRMRSTPSRRTTVSTDSGAARWRGPFTVAGVDGPARPRAVGGVAAGVGGTLASGCHWSGIGRVARGWPRRHPRKSACRAHGCTDGTAGGRSTPCWRCRPPRGGRHGWDRPSGGHGS